MREKNVPAAEYSVGSQSVTCISCLETRGFCWKCGAQINDGLFTPPSHNVFFTCEQITNSVIQWKKNIISWIIDESNYCLHVLTPLYGKFEPQFGDIPALAGKLRPESSNDGDPLSDMNTMIVFCNIFFSFSACTTRPTDSSNLDTMATIKMYFYRKNCKPQCYIRRRMLLSTENVKKQSIVICYYNS